MDFDKIASQYDAWFTTPLGSAIDRWEKEITWRLARPAKGEKVLDIGTGTANYLLELARLGLDCAGLDVGSGMLLRAREKAAREALSLKLCVAKAEALPFKTARFDLVLSVTAFEFFTDPARAVAEMCRVCRPGGRIVVGVLNKWSLWAVRRRVLSWFQETVFTDCRFYSYPEMKRLFGSVEWGTAAFAPPGLPACLISLFNCMEPCLQRLAKPFGAYLVVAQKRP
jgi:ubiquinone/menaquinone biosynthesis C-methylase UbiE